MKPRLFSLIPVLLFFSLSFSFSQTPKVHNLKCEYMVNPVGIDIMNPGLSWQITSSERDMVQTAYQIIVAENEKDLNNDDKLIWSTGQTKSDQSTHIVYQGPTLTSGKKYYWQVRVWDNKKQKSDWSEPAYWEMGLLKASDWLAKWIQPGWEEGVSKSQPAPFLRKSFKLKGDIKEARAYITALGLYHAEINGIKIGNQLFTPGWTSYNKRLQYQTYDVTDLLKNGRNAVGVILGDGWYRGNLAWRKNRNVYGDKLALLLQIEVVYTTGKKELIITDDSWKATTGPVLSSDIYNGEVYDAQLEIPGWSTSGFNDKTWTKVKLIENPKTVLVASSGPPVKRIQEVKPVSLLITPDGETVLDMGQNMVGWIRLEAEGKAGDTITLRHAEVLDKEGNFYTENLRRAEQLVRYILKGEGRETYEPHFTFQGFRYVMVEGYPGKLTLDDLTGIVIHSDITPTGFFSCSNPLLNQLQHNIQWGQKGNFLDVPTDCPQRDERLGWTGDAQVFSRAACYNADVAAFFTKWLKDLGADQKEDGSVPYVIPNVLGENAVASAGWADAATIIPWNTYLAYGDKAILEEQYTSMVKWVGYMTEKAGDSYLWNTGFHYGDWLFYRPDDDNDGRSAVTDKYLIAQAFFAHSTDLLRKTAKVLGKHDDEQKYAQLLANVKKAFNREYVTPNGRLVSGTQTAYLLALKFDLLPENQRQSAIERLVHNIRGYNNHITTGFLGAPYLCDVLTDYGYIDVAYELLLQESYPSWLYPVKMGATTIWERWDGIKPDSSFQNPGMNSFNHYAYGAIGDWMYRVIAGIDTDEKIPGYKQIIIHPRPGGNLNRAEGRYESMYGTIRSSWRIEDGKFLIDITVPVNTEARVVLPNADLKEVLESGMALSASKGIHSKTQEGHDVVLEVGSGDYRFEYLLSE